MQVPLVDLEMITPPILTLDAWAVSL